MSITLVIPTSLYMGWIEDPPYLCTVSETGQDVAKQYVDIPAVPLAPHKFVKLTEANPEFLELPQIDISDDPFNYMLGVYVENYIALAIPRSRSQLHYVANILMTGIHDVFSPYKDEDEDAIYLKKFLKKEGAWAVIKNIMGFDFGVN